MLLSLLIVRWTECPSGSLAQVNNRRTSLRWFIFIQCVFSCCLCILFVRFVQQLESLRVSTMEGCFYWEHPHIIKLWVSLLLSWFIGERFTDKRQPNRQAFTAVFQRVSVTVCMELRVIDRGRSKVACKTDLEDPGIIIRQLNVVFPVSWSITRKMLHEHCLCSYNLQRVQGLLADDYYTSRVSCFVPDCLLRTLYEWCNIHT